jgi:hypothetical protein
MTEFGLIPFFLLQVLNLTLIKAKYGPNSYAIALLLVTTFIGINPIYTQRVLYLVQRVASLAGRFYMMTTYLVILKDRCLR